MNLDDFIVEFQELLVKHGVVIVDTGAAGDSNPRFIKVDDPEWQNNFKYTIQSYTWES